MVGIYKIENLINHHCYIGQSRNIEKRWEDHKIAAFNSNQKSYDYPLYRAIRKYGLSNFSFEVIELCTVEELNSKEIYWIGFYHAFGEGYNQTIGGNIIAHPKLTESQIIEIKNRLINFVDTDTHQKIASDYCVSTDTIQAINNGRVWYDDKLIYPLHKSKYAQIGKYFYCIDCGKRITKNATRCNDCNNKYKRTVNQPPLSREELKQLIRTTPFTTIGKQYGVSDNAVRKWCDKYNLPRRSKEIKSYSLEEWDTI